MEKYTSKNNSEYELHEDRFAGDTKDIKLTAIMNLSEVPYEGGEFWINAGSPFHAKEFTIGSIIMLKSHVLHRVTPVTKGKRISLTHFMEGPRFI